MLCCIDWQVCDAVEGDFDEGNIWRAVHGGFPASCADATARTGDKGRIRNQLMLELLLNRLSDERKVDGGGVDEKMIKVGEEHDVVPGGSHQTIMGYIK